jgi:hypothetical protein
MGIATVHVSAVDLELDGSYEPNSDVLYLSAPGDAKRAPAQATPEGHAVRLDDQGRITHLTAVNAKWLLDRDGELVATLRDGRQLRLGRDDVGDIVA